MVCRFHLGAFDQCQFFQRDWLLSLTSFQRDRATMFTYKEMLQRRQKIRAQTSFLFANRIEVSALQKHRKKILSEIFGFIWAGAFPSDKAINRSPIGAAKFFERVFCCRRLTLRFKD